MSYKQILQKLHKVTKPVAKFRGAERVHRVADGAYLAISMTEWGNNIDTSSPDAANNKENDFLHNHADLSFLILDLAVLMLWSVVADSRTPKEERSELQCFLIFTWPYLRDMLSGLKNGQKAVNNTGFIIGQVGHASGFMLTNAIGFGIGIALALNLIWYRHMDEKRKQMLDNNKALLEDIKKQKNPLPLLRLAIQDQTTLVKGAAYVSAFFDGMTDGAYLYGCLFMLTTFGVCSFPPSVLLAASIVIAFYILCSIVTKLSEEYEKQYKLQRSIDECELELEYNKAEGTKQGDKYNTMKAQFDKKYNSQEEALPPYKRALWMILRALLSGLKNGKQVIDFIGTFIHKAVTFLVISFVVGGVYAFYQGISCLYKQLDDYLKNNHYHSTVQASEEPKAKPAPSVFKYGGCLFSSCKPGNIDSSECGEISSFSEPAGPDLYSHA